MDYPTIKRCLSAGNLTVMSKMLMIKLILLVDFKTEKISKKIRTYKTIRLETFENKAQF